MLIKWHIQIIESSKYFMSFVKIVSMKGHKGRQRILEIFWE